MVREIAAVTVAADTFFKKDRRFTLSFRTFEPVTYSGFYCWHCAMRATHYEVAPARR
jgi:hypothetical protein